MAARRVRFYGHGDARVVAPETPEDDAAGGKAASQEEGGLRRPAAGVQGRGPPLRLQVVVRPAVAAASASGRRRVARSVRVRTLPFGGGFQAVAERLPGRATSSDVAPRHRILLCGRGLTKSVPARHRAHY